MKKRFLNSVNFVIILSVLLIVFIFNCSLREDQNAQTTTTEFRVLPTTTSTTVTIVYVKEGSFKFAVLGDSGPRADINNCSQPDVLKEILNDIQAGGYNHSIHLGDLIIGIFTSDQSLDGIRAQFQKYLDLSAILTKPHYITIGNHDYWNNNYKQIFMEKFGSISGNTEYYSFDVQNSHFVILNSETIGQNNQIPIAQQTWLLNDLKMNNKYNVFVFAHKPFYSASSPTNNYVYSNYVGIDNIFKQYRPTIVFSGHIHKYTDTISSTSVRQIFAGTGGSPLALVNDTDPPLTDCFSYLSVIVNNENVSVEVKRPYDFTDDVYTGRAIWKYNSSGIYPGSNWTNVSFDDSTWNSGKNGLGYGTLTGFRQIHTPIDSTTKHITYYFRKKFNIADKTKHSNLRLEVIYDAGIVAYLNGTEVARKNISAGTIDENTLGTKKTSDDYNETDLPIGNTNLINGENVICVELHKDTADSDLYFEASLN